MNGLNLVVLFGNLGADPILRTSDSGWSVLKLSLATTETYFDKQNARQERTEWHSVAIFGKRGEGLSNFLKKGDRVLIEGSIRTRCYEKDGVKRYATEIVAKNVVLNGGKRSNKVPSASSIDEYSEPADAEDFGNLESSDDVERGCPF